MNSAIVLFDLCRLNRDTVQLRGLAIITQIVNILSTGLHTFSASMSFHLYLQYFSKVLNPKHNSDRVAPNMDKIINIFHKVIKRFN